VKLITFIIPVLNEQDNINIFIEKINSIFLREKLIDRYVYNYLFIDDGSVDDTFKILKKLNHSDKRVGYIKLSRNFGKECALTAGLNNCDCDLAIIIDCDLEDDPNLIPEFLKNYEEGYEIVVAKRSSRNDPIIKKFLSNLFYIIFNLLSDDKIPNNVSDYRLISKKVINALKLYNEKNRFMKGIFSLVGFTAKEIRFERAIKRKDKPRQNFSKLFNLTFNAFLNFSGAPIRLIFYLGLIIAALSLLFLIFVTIKKIFFGIDVPGFTTLLCLILFFGGINILFTGIIGMYVLRVYEESKNRPLYIVEKKSD